MLRGMESKFITSVSGIVCFIQIRIVTYFLRIGKTFGMLLFQPHAQQYKIE